MPNCYAKFYELLGLHPRPRRLEMSFSMRDSHRRLNYRNNVRGVLVLLCSMALLSCFSCDGNDRRAPAAPPVTKSRVEIKASDYYGDWMIDDKSLGFLFQGKALISKTNRFNHAFSLHSDGTASHAGMLCYIPVESSQMESSMYFSSSTNEALWAQADFSLSWLGSRPAILVYQKGDDPGSTPFHYFIEDDEGGGKVLWRPFFRDKIYFVKTSRLIPFSEP